LHFIKHKTDFKSHIIIYNTFYIYNIFYSFIYLLLQYRFTNSLHQLKTYFGVKELLSGMRIYKS